MKPVTFPAARGAPRVPASLRPGRTPRSGRGGPARDGEILHPTSRADHRRAVVEGALQDCREVGVRACARIVLGQTVAGFAAVGVRGVTADAVADSFDADASRGPADAGLS